MRAVCFRTGLSAFISAAVLILSTIPAAWADSNDDAYMKELEAAGMNGGPTAIDAAKYICKWLWHGELRSSLVNETLDSNPSMSYRQASILVASASKHYCPSLP
jgi:hypothetical protein